MARFVVMEPPGRAEADLDGARIVRDGFSIVAFLVPPLFLLWHRLWIEAALVVAASLVLAMLGEVAGLGVAGSGLSLLLALYFGFEGSTLRIAALRRRGWHEWGAVDADNLGDAEVRYALSLDEQVQDGPRTPTPPIAGPWLSPGPALGLLHYPGRN